METIAEVASGEKSELRASDEVVVHTGGRISLAGMMRINPGMMSALYGRGIFSRLSSFEDSRPHPGAVPERPSRFVLVLQEFAELDLSQERAALAIALEDELGYVGLRREMKLPSRLHRTLAALDIDTFTDESVTAYKRDMRLHAQGKEDLRALERNDFVRTLCWNSRPLKEYTQPIPEYVLRKCRQIKQAEPRAEFEVCELTYDPDPFMVVKLGGESAYFEVWDEPTFAG